MTDAHTAPALAELVDSTILQALSERDRIFFEGMIGKYPNEVIIAEIVLLSKAGQRKATTKQDLTEVVRKYRCSGCGYFHSEGVTVTLNGINHETGVWDATGWWSCDECGAEYWDTPRITRKDLA